MSSSSHKKRAIQYILIDEAEQKPASIHNQERQKHRLESVAATISPSQMAINDITITSLSMKDQRHHLSQIGATSIYDHSTVSGPADSHPNKPLQKTDKEPMKAIRCEICLHTFAERVMIVFT